MSDDVNSRLHRGAEAHRRARRCPLPGVLVAIDAPRLSEQPWVVDALDLSSHGMGLVLPPELPGGTEVLLSCKLAEGRELARVPATVRHREGSSGGVVFGEWSAADRLALLELLVERYEVE